MIILDPPLAFAPGVYTGQIAAVTPVPGGFKLTLRGVKPSTLPERKPLKFIRGRRRRESRP